MGTWALPKTKEQALKLKDLLEKPLKAGEAEDKLYDLLGDDNLFDDIMTITEEEGEEALVNYLVLYYLDEKVIKQIGNYTDSHIWDSEVPDILISLFKNNEGNIDSKILDTGLKNTPRNKLNQLYLLFCSLNYYKPQDIITKQEIHTGFNDFLVKYCFSPIIKTY